MCDRTSDTVGHSAQLHSMYAHVYIKPRGWGEETSSEYHVTARSLIAFLKY